MLSFISMYTAERLGYTWIMDPAAEISVLNKALDPLSESLTPDGARCIIELRPDPETIVLLEELGNKANEGTLTEEETRLYESHVRAGNLITLLQAKARKFLAEDAA